ncbi:hypothetical protein, partial [Enterocloster bolteae]|uniref:hypothetical protein n=1 Tax=Enterocloster bolteae TaxID=208479 RepID=UPI00210E43B9
MMVYGPSGGGSDITEEMVYDVLEQKGICFGIDEELPQPASPVTMAAASITPINFFLILTSKIFLQGDNSYFLIVAYAHILSIVIKSILAVVQIYAHFQ